jgi:hypothetical protein
MRLSNIILLTIILFGFSGCHMGPITYEIFERNANSNTGGEFIPYMNKNKRQIYSEDKYIYIFKGNPKGCIHGYLTNKDDKPEKVLGWVILKGEEHCKEQQGYAFSF